MALTPILNAFLVCVLCILCYSRSSFLATSFIFGFENPIKCTLLYFRKFWAILFNATTKVKLNLALEDEFFYLKEHGLLNIDRPDTSD